MLMVDTISTSIRSNHLLGACTTEIKTHRLGMDSMGYRRVTSTMDTDERTGVSNAASTCW